MTNYNTAGDVVLGQGTATYADDVDVYIEGISTDTTVGASGTDVSDLGNNTNIGPGNDNRFAVLDGNTSSLTGENVTYFLTNFRNSGTGNSVPVVFRNSRIHFGHDRSTTNNWFFPLELENVDLFSSGSGVGGVWGIYGNGSGNNYPTFTADGHIDLDALNPNGGLGDGARAIARLWTWNNVRIFFDGGVQLLLNGALPANEQGYPDGRTSVFSNVDFNPVDGRGAFGELPFLPFVDARWGQFYRAEFPNPGDLIWARLTGGMNRNQIGIGTNWMIQPQWDIRNLDGQTAQVSVDGRCFVYFVNFVLPADPSNLVLRGGQGTSATSTGQNGPTRIINAYGWNPVINQFPGAPALDIKYTWDNTVFQMHSVPATFTGGNLGGTAVLPTAINPGTTGYEEPADFNGFFVIENDVTLTDNARALGITIAPYTSRDVHLFSYNTQFNTITDGTFTQNFGRTVTITPGDYQIQITPDATSQAQTLTWRAEDVINEPVDPFLNGRALADGEPLTDITNLDWAYPTLKAIAYRVANRDDNRLPIVPTEGALQFMSGVIFNAGSNNGVAEPSPGVVVTTIRLQNEATVGTIGTLRFMEVGSVNNPLVNWTTRERTFDAPLTIAAGSHSFFPAGRLTDADDAWPNGLTFADATEIFVGNTTFAEYDWTNVSIPVGASVNFLGNRNTPLEIRGLATDDRQRVTANGAAILDGNALITFVNAPIENTIRIPVRAGRFALRINGVEAVAPRAFTQAEIDAGVIEFIVSDQESGSGTEFSDMVDGALIELYMKYDNTFGADPEPNSVYQEQYSTQVYDGTRDETLLAFTAPTPITPVLVGFAIAPPASVGFMYMAADADGPDRFEISGATGDNTDLAPTGVLSSSQSQGLAIQIANSPEYFLAWYNNRNIPMDTQMPPMPIPNSPNVAPTPIVDYPVNAAQWNAEYITFGSGQTNAANNRIQQQGADWSAEARDPDLPTVTLVLSRSGAPEINFPPSVQAALSTVLQASQEALASELDARRVTRSNIGNLGLLAPALDPDGNIIPVTPPSGG